MTLLRFVLESAPLILMPLDSQGLCITDISLHFINGWKFVCVCTCVCLYVCYYFSLKFSGNLALLLQATRKIGVPSFGFSVTNDKFKNRYSRKLEENFIRVGMNNIRPATL